MAQDGAADTVADLTAATVADMEADGTAVMAEDGAADHMVGFEVAILVILLSTRIFCKFKKFWQNQKS